MLWTKASRFKPPADIPVYVIFDREEGHTEIFTEEELAEVHTETSWQLFKKEYLGLIDEDDRPRILKWWSFIPITPPDEIMPILGGINTEIERLKIEVKNLIQDLASIPRITSFQRQIEALQIQIAKINPDSYHRARCKDLSKKIDPAPAPLGNQATPPPAEVKESWNKPKKSKKKKK